MRKNKFLLLVATLALMLVFALSAFAAEDIVFNFTDEKSFTGWGTGYLRYDFTPGYFNGYAYEKSANLSDPMLTSPKLDIQAEDYRYVVVHMSFTMDASWSKRGSVFFNTPGTNWDASRQVNSEVYGTTNMGFKDIIIDMSVNANWTGTITQIRFDPFDCHGSVKIKSITLTNTLPEPEVKEETPGTSQPETPKKATGVFLKPNTYAGNFSDVPADAWYAKEVANAYELGLINGKSETSFDPDGSMTVAEAVTLAARTRNNYGTADYDFTPGEGMQWYTPYVDYAKSNGIIKEGDFADYTVPVTRGGMAKIFASALPSSEYAYINSVTKIPDVPSDNPYFSAVYKLYNAGIVMGNDVYGTFNPDNTIKRSEAAAIINRIANKENRLSKNLVSTIPELNLTAPEMKSEAKYYADDEVFRNAHTGAFPSGWNLWPTLESVAKNGKLSTTLSDGSPDVEGYFERKFNTPATEGVLDIEIGITFGGANGAYLELTDDKKNPVVRLNLDMGKFTTLGPDGTYTDTGAKRNQSLVHFDIKLNLDTGKFILGVDGAYIGEFPVAANLPVHAFNFGTTKEGWMNITGKYCSIRHNWLATEKFVNAPDNILPYDINVINEGGKVSKVMMNTFNNNGGTLSLKSDSGKKTGISHKFAAASGNILFETYIILPEDLNGAKIALKNGSNDVFFLETKDGNFVSPDGSTVKYVTKNLWHIVRIEADTATDTALVKINGKTIGTYPFASASDVIDGYEITYTPASESTIYVDEIAAYINLPYPDDYVPEPVVPESDDYIVGLNVCSLWRTGTHYGWDEITAYPEIEPVLGYYDEGTPETSDWEIKMMSEHGIDYEIFCWYADADTNKPIFRTEMNEAIVDGYFNARYSDKLKFAIMWENTSIDCKSWQSWTDYFVPYFIEYFFLDDRYMKIDNKPVFTVWSLDALGSAFGEKSSKEAFDYLRAEAKKVGFDDLIIMLYSSDHTTSYAERAKNAGFDCIGAYHYGAGGANLEKHLASLTSLKNENTIDRIPAVSVGFDYVGWGSSTKRNGLLDPADYPTVTDYIKNEILAKRDQSSIYSKMVIISTWNEYGEGTYVMPTARHGFKYLDAVRAAFTNGGEHTDVVPTTAQKKRINYMFDQNRQWLRPQLLEVEEKVEVDPYADAVEVKKITFEDPTAIKWAGYGDTRVENIEGILHVTTSGKDPAMFSNSSICNIPATEANAVKIRAKIQGNQTAGSMELFFKTNDGKDYSADKFMNHKITLDEWTDYIFDFRKVATWKGNIINLRIDPANFRFDLAEIESITFIKLPEIVEIEPFTVDINGAELTLFKEPDRTNGGLMITVYPENGDFARMKAHHKWNKNTKELTVYNNQHTVTMFIGTDKIITDGVESKMYAKTYMYDGLPVIPFDTLAKALGYFVVEHEDGNGVSIMLDSPDDYNVIKDREPYKYEFGISGDYEDWTAGNCTIDVANGVLKGTPTNNDPAITSPTLKINAASFPIIKIRMKWHSNNPSGKETAAIYFKTATTSLSESRRVNVSLPGASSGGEFVELTFDMSKHLQWYGTITNIRFDPFNYTGNFEIDYIRFEKDMATQMAEMFAADRAANLDDTISNGDAEISGYNPMSSDNSTITIVPREDGEGSCYNVKAAGGKVWTYTNQKVKYVPGTKYTVEFDVKLIGTNDGNTADTLKTSFYVNLMYNGDGKRDHNTGVGEVSVADGWKHMKATITVSPNCNNENDVVGIYGNPIGSLGVNYQIDNIVMYPAEG